MGDVYNSSRTNARKVYHLYAGCHAGHMIDNWDRSDDEPDEYEVADAAAANTADDHATGHCASLEVAAETEGTPAVPPALQSDVAPAHQVGVDASAAHSPVGVDATVDLPADVEDMSHEAVRYRAVKSLRESQGASKGAALGRALLRRLAAVALGDEIVASAGAQ